MQDNWQYQLYHQETTPPQGAWEKIAGHLDTADRIDKIYHQETTPPQDTWEKIARHLDTADRIDKIYHQEEEPPPDLWSSIAASLDAGIQPAWQQNIYAQETIPPADVWAAISQQLDAVAKDTPAAAVPIRKRNWYRTAAAAAVIAGILASGLWLMNREPKPPVDVAGVTPVVPGTANPSAIPQVPDQAAAINTGSTAAQQVSPASNHPSPAQHLPGTTAAMPQNRQAVIPPLSYITDTPDTPDHRETAIAFLNNRPMDNPNGNAVANMDNTITVANGNYISISGPDGQTIRLSSKFSNLVGYLNDTSPENEELLDKIIRESAFWKARFRKWREKMQQNLSAPSPNNFLDLVELGKTLEEKE